MYQTSRTLGVIWSDLVRDRLFVVGLLLKLVLILFFIPTIQTDWFVPFVVGIFESPGVSPWSSFVNTGRDVLSFPYGPIMLLAHIPTTFLGYLADLTTGSNYFAGLGFRLSLLGADILLLLVLLQQFEDRWRGLMIHYWLSPLVLLITYWHGQTDLIPMALFVMSIALLKANRLAYSGVIFAASIAAKHSMLVAAPFILIYLWFKSSNVVDVYKFLRYFLPTLLLSEGWLLFDYGFQQMVLNNRESEKVFWLFISMGDTLKIYILPLVYLFLVYLTWGLRRINFELLLATLGVAFSFLILLTPASPGWFLWLTPILALHYSQRNSNAILLGYLFSFLFVLYHLVYSSGASIVYIHESVSFALKIVDVFFSSLYIQSLLNTAIVGLAIVITLQLYRDGVKGSDYYHLGRKPLVIGVAGAHDSGKSVFAKFLTDLFGERKTLVISGESYFNWSIGSPMWKTMTAYNPGASNIFLMIRDLRKALDGKLTKERNLKSTPIRGLQQRYQVVVVTALHALHVKQLAEMCDVKFFLSNSENGQEGQELKDYEKYIKPQEDRADIIFRSNDKNSENIDLFVKIRDGAYYQELFRVLIGICGLQMEVVQIGEDGSVEFIVQGEIQSDDIQLAADVITPNLKEFVNSEGGFHGGTIGVMQLLALIEIDEVLKRRRSAV